MPGEYDDWELTVRAWENGVTEILIELPHHYARHIEINVDPGQIQTVSNILDAGLSALQTKPKEVDHGSNPAGPNR